MQGSNSASLGQPDFEAPAVQGGRDKRWVMLLVLFVCFLPVAASYITYYFIRPSARSNYGELVEPQRPTPALTLRTLDGAAFDPKRLKGKWLMLMVGGGDCARPCQDKLYNLRQVRLTTGKDRDRVERVWLITDRAPISPALLQSFECTRMLRADLAELASWLGPGTRSNGPTEPANAIEDHIYMVDPLENLMMRFPKDGDPNRIKKDLAKLLKASSIG